MKKITPFQFLFLSHLCMSQSYIRLIGGMDFTDFGLQKRLWYGQGVHYRGDFTLRSPVLGVKGQHHLSRSFSVAASAAFTKKETQGYIYADGWGVDINFISYKSLQSRLLLNYHFSEKWFVGLGPSVQYIYDTRVADVEGTGKEYPFLSSGTKRELGLTLSPGFQYKNLLLEIYYHKSLALDSEYYYDFKPLDFFGVSLGFLFRVAKGGK